jgi:hypothetical protein
MRQIQQTPRGAGLRSPESRHTPAPRLRYSANWPAKACFLRYLRSACAPAPPKQTPEDHGVVDHPLRQGEKVKIERDVSAPASKAASRSMQDRLKDMSSMEILGLSSEDLKKLGWVAFWDIPEGLLKPDQERAIQIRMVRERQ